MDNKEFMEIWQQLGNDQQMDNLDTILTQKTVRLRRPTETIASLIVSNKVTPQHLTEALQRLGWTAPAEAVSTPAVEQGAPPGGEQVKTAP